jgi:hypothetical protein
VARDILNKNFLKKKIEKHFFLIFSKKIFKEFKKDLKEISGFFVGCIFGHIY